MCGRRSSSWTECFREGTQNKRVRTRIKRRHDRENVGTKNQSTLQRSVVRAAGMGRQRRLKAIRQTLADVDMQAMRCIIVIFGVGKVVQPRV